MSITLTRRAWKKGSHQQAAGIIAALVVLAVGFCLIHAHHLGADHGMCPDPCAVMAASVAFVLFSLLLADGRLRLEPVRSLYAVSLHLLDPPPKALAVS